jgi:hypothetical protein
MEMGSVGKEGVSCTFPLRGDGLNFEEEKGRKGSGA